MYLLGLGLVLLLLKVADIAPVAAWSWWAIAAPFGLAVAWWSWADRTGYTKRKATEREDARKAERIERQRDNLGLRPKKKPR